MTIRAWRIVKARPAANAFTGGGARTFGGRWNSPGVAIVYTAGSLSLAMLEILVHAQAEELLKRYVTFEVSFDESLVSHVDPASLPRNWRRSPGRPALQQLGDDWVASGRSAVLYVPSAIVPTEGNYLLHPVHPDFAKVAIGPRQPLRIDPRLVKASGR